MNIVHLTDLHFGNPDAVFDWRELATSLSEYLKNKVDNPVLIVSGDVTYKGAAKGYEEARKFFKLLLQNGVTSRNRILMCPGNHDIVGKSFNEFDSFTYSLRRDNNCFFSDNHINTALIDGCLFKLLNSSYHLDHEYGLIDQKSLAKDKPDHKGLKIAITHHHLLNMFENDTSAIRNSYNLAEYLSSEGFKYVLHGHQHAEQNYYLGENALRVISARSGNFGQKGFFNSVNIYRINKEEFTGEVLLLENSSSGIKFREMAL
ncbi:MAG: metallophosphoesterase [Pseudomonadales bacterium]